MGIRSRLQMLIFSMITTMSSLGLAQSWPPDPNDPVFRQGMEDTRKKMNFCNEIKNVGCVPGYVAQTWCYELHVADASIFFLPMCGSTIGGRTPMPPTISDWCRRPEKLSYDEVHTLNVLMAAIGATNCDQVANILSSIDHIDLSNSGLKSIEVLSGLWPYGLYENSNNKIKVLNLSGNQISDLSPIEWIQSLEYLDASDNQITSPASNSLSRNLVEINLSNNGIQDPALASWFFSAKHMNLSENPIPAEKKKCPRYPESMCEF